MAFDNLMKDKTELVNEWSDARAAWNFRISRARRVNKTEDLFLCDSYLILCKPYPICGGSRLEAHRLLVLKWLGKIRAYHLQRLEGQPIA